MDLIIFIIRNIFFDISRKENIYFDNLDDYAILAMVN